MKISSRFTIAVHTLIVIDLFSGAEKTTSEFIAASVGVNPVVIRRTLQSLKAAGLVNVKAGSGGAELAKPLSDTTLLDVFYAVDALDGEMFGFHSDPNPACPVGRNIHAVLDGYLLSAQSAFERDLAAVTLDKLDASLRQKIRY